MCDVQVSIALGHVVTSGDVWTPNDHQVDPGEAEHDINLDVC